MDKLKNAMITAVTVTMGALVIFATWYIGSTTLFNILSVMGE
jgi:hypothetical protein